MLRYLRGLFLASCLVGAVVPTIAAEATDSVRDLSHALRTSQASELRPLLSSERRVRIALPTLGIEDGFVGADQAFLLFKRLFDSYKTESFKVSEQGESRAEGIVLRGEWVLEGKRGRKYRLTVIIVLGLEGEESWVLRELRGSRD